MTRTIEVEIDDSGTVRPMDPAASLAHRRALLVWRTETFLDPVSRAIADAPIDDEPESEDERRAVAESKAWLAAHPGQTISHADMTMLLSEQSLAVDWLRPEGRGMGRYAAE